MLFVYTPVYCANSIVLKEVTVSNIQQKVATFYWDTNVETKSDLYIGSGLSLSTMKVFYHDSLPIKSHKVIISELKPNTKYYYRIKSYDINGKFLTSVAYTFLTHGSLTSLDTVAPSTPELSIINVSYNNITFLWSKATDNKNVAGYVISGFNNTKNKGIILIVKGDTINKISISKGFSLNTFYFKEYGSTAGFAIQSYDSSGNYSPMSSRIKIYIPDNLNCLSLVKDSINFSSFLNSTGNPIGGGKCYTKIINKSQATYLVKTKQELINSLTIAKRNDIIYVEDTCNLDLTGQFLKLNAGVTLCSGRGNNSEGALLYSNSLTNGALLKALFETNGDSVRITGIRIKGPSPDIWDHDLRRGIANGIRCKHANLEVDNCEIFNWNKWAIWLYYSKNAYIHHNYIRNTTLAGYGYLIWCGGMGGEMNSYALIEANWLEGARHCIASSGHWNSWEARYNIIMHKQFYANLDRHAGANNMGGKNTIVRRNMFYSNLRHFGFYKPADPTGMDTITQNFFKLKWNQAGGVDTITYENTTLYPQVRYYGNYFSDSGKVVPKAIIWTDKISGTVPLTIEFDGSMSFDENKIPISQYFWRFGDGDYNGNEKRDLHGKYTFNEPGIYTITLFVANAYGVISEIAQKNITVNPAITTEKKYILSVWVKDSYPDTLIDRYVKQILVDNQVVWSDDVAGDEGWQHVIVDISSFGGVGSKHRIASRLFSKNGVSDYINEICELYYWTDDFMVFNTDSYMPSFENDKIYPPWNQAFYYPAGAVNMSTAITTEDARSGEKSFRLRFAYGSNAKPGQWGEVYTGIIFK